MKRWKFAIQIVDKNNIMQEETIEILASNLPSALRGLGKSIVGMGWKKRKNSCHLEISLSSVEKEGG